MYNVTPMTIRRDLDKLSEMDPGVIRCHGGAVLATEVNSEEIFEKKQAPSIQLDRIREIHKAVGIPLVLHGSCGIPRDVIEKSFHIGIGKINVNTELALAGCRGAKDYMDSFGGTPVMRMP